MKLAIFIGTKDSGQTSLTGPPSTAAQWSWKGMGTMDTEKISPETAQLVQELALCSQEKFSSGNHIVDFPLLMWPSPLTKATKKALGIIEVPENEVDPIDLAALLVQFTAKP